MKIIFTKSNGTTTSASVANASSNSPTASSNANAIAFPISCPGSHTDVYNSGNWDNQYEGQISHLWFPKNTEVVTCTISGNSISNTYDMNDLKGSYTARLTLTRLNVDSHD